MDDVSYPYYRKTVGAFYDLKDQAEALIAAPPRKGRKQVEELTKALQKLGEELNLTMSRFKFKEDLVLSLAADKGQAQPEAVLPASYLAKDVSTRISDAPSSCSSSTSSDSPSEDEWYRNHKSLEDLDKAPRSPTFEDLERDLMSLTISPVPAISPIYLSSRLGSPAHQSPRPGSPLREIATSEDINIPTTRDNTGVDDKLKWILQDFDYIKNPTARTSSDSETAPEASRRQRRQRHRQEKKAEVLLPVAPRTLADPTSSRRAVKVATVDYERPRPRPRPAPGWSMKDFPPL